jgi:hypothetical protein
MNERIKKLIEQSGLDYYDLWEKDRKAVNELVYLIVVECNKVLKQNWTMGGSSSTIYAIKKHFGVE